ncbi:MAG: hypothetical protein VKQ33_03645 [Candidatus Sericytochromatia bacterium]|nr:hypothetical protein [Candidatus Sericytochromatia bacterium]
MGPVVSLLERRYAGRVTVRRYVLDRLVPGSPEHLTAYGLAEAVGLSRTPTYLVVAPDGRVRAVFTGATGWLSLSTALEAVGAAAP